MRELADAVAARLDPIVALTRADRGAWSAVARDAAPYLDPDFVALAAPFVAPETPLVATAWQGDRAIGALPLALDDAHQRLHALRSDHSPGYDYCGTAEGVAAIWRALRDDPRWSELFLDRVPAGSLLATALPALAEADGCRVAIRGDAAHPYFALRGFEAALDKKFLTNLRRCARRAEPLALERLVAPTAADLAEAEAIEAMAWKASAGTDIASDPRAVALYATMTATFGPRGQAALAFLRSAGKRIASLFTLEDARTLYALKIGYDPAHRQISPGHLLIWKVAADAEARGLEELDFVGREDEWKRRWTELLHARRAITIYRRSARGLVRYALREVIKPRLPAPLRETPRSPLPRRCQRADILGDHALVVRATSRLLGGFGIRRALRRALGRRLRAPQPPPLGAPSTFPVGSYVRVLDARTLAGILDARDRTRGLAFTQVQWQACGRVFRVAKHVRRLRDDRGQFRAVSRTVLLDGVHCGFEADEPSGCGRHCPLMFRDEWLEAADAPVAAAAIEPAVAKRYARVKALDEINASLDLFGRRDGLTFMPEMAEYARGRFAIAGTLTRVFEHDRWVEPRAPIYLLDGLHCRGGVVGARGPCDRACALLWHGDWLVVESERG